MIEKSLSLCKQLKIIFPMRSCVVQIIINLNRNESVLGFLIRFLLCTKHMTVGGSLKKEDILIRV